MRLATMLAIGIGLSCVVWSSAVKAEADRMLPGTDVPERKVDHPDLVASCKDAQVVLVAKVKSVEYAQTHSMPPHSMTIITLEDATTLKGQVPERLTFSLSGMLGGVEKGSKVIVPLKDGRPICFELATDENIAAVKKAIEKATTSPAAPPVPRNP